MNGCSLARDDVNITITNGGGRGEMRSFGSSVGDGAITHISSSSRDEWVGGGGGEGGQKGDQERPREIVHAVKTRGTNRYHINQGRPCSGDQGRPLETTETSETMQLRPGRPTDTT